LVIITVIIAVGFVRGFRLFVLYALLFKEGLGSSLGAELTAAPNLDNKTRKVQH